jgi:acetylornithine deacetylase/succinyl-diaminopimelate desuccinylase-like protein
VAFRKGTRSSSKLFLLIPAALINLLENPLKEPDMNDTPKNSLKSNNLHHLAPLGVSCVCTGPGGMGAHAENEYVLISHVVDITKVLALSIIQFLGVEEA